VRQIVHQIYTLYLATISQAALQSVFLLLPICVALLHLRMLDDLVGGLLAAVVTHKFFQTDYSTDDQRNLAHNKRLSRYNGNGVVCHL